MTYRPGTPDTWRSPWQMYADVRDHDPVHRVLQPTTVPLKVAG